MACIANMKTIHEAKLAWARITAKAARYSSEADLLSQWPSPSAGSLPGRRSTVGRWQKSDL
jgi:hypothetical protein